MKENSKKIIPKEKLNKAIELGNNNSHSSLNNIIPPDLPAIPQVSLIFVLAHKRLCDYCISEDQVTISRV